MRLATLDHDYWQLRSAEQLQQENPETFWIPFVEKRRNLARGKAAKLIFDIETEDKGKNILTGERMWVIVSERHEDIYIGILDNKPACLFEAENVYLCFGAEIPFKAEHVIDIADPPANYVEWQLSQPAARVWPRGN